MYVIKSRFGSYYVAPYKWATSITNAKRFRTVLEAAWTLGEAEFDEVPASVVCSECGESPCVPLLAAVWS